jgi:hypothetical protein
MTETTEALAKPPHSGECAYTTPCGLVRQNERGEGFATGSTTLEKPMLESLADELSRLEDMEDLMELRSAVETNAGKPGVSWEDTKKELGLD